MVDYAALHALSVLRRVSLCPLAAPHATHQDPSTVQTFMLASLGRHRRLATAAVRPLQAGRGARGGVHVPALPPPLRWLSTQSALPPPTGRGLVARVRDHASALALGGPGPSLTPAAVRSRLGHALGAVVGVVFLLACLVTGSQDYETTQALLRCTQGLRRARKASAVALASLTSETRCLVGKGGRQLVCHMCRPGGPAAHRPLPAPCDPAGTGAGQPAGQRPTVVLLAEEGMFPLHPVAATLSRGCCGWWLGLGAGGWG